MPYYHIRVKYKSGEDILFGYELNLPDTSVAEISSDYLSMKDLFLDGKVIHNTRIEEIKVFRTVAGIGNTSDSLKEMHPYGYDFRYLEGNEVTRDFIKKPPSLPVEKASPLSVTREGVFFKGQQYDAYKLIRGILREANENIVIIDSYVDESVLNMLESKKEGVKTQILTNSESGRAVRTAGNRFNSQYKNLQIRTSRDFHDRFLIIDDKDFYHFGHSIKNLGDRSCMFSRIEEQMIIETLRNEFIKVWERSQVIL